MCTHYKRGTLTLTSLTCLESWRVDPQPSWLESTAYYTSYVSPYTIGRHPCWLSKYIFFRLTTVWALANEPWVWSICQFALSKPILLMLIIIHFAHLKQGVVLLNFPFFWDEGLVKKKKKNWHSCANVNMSMFSLSWSCLTKMQDNVYDLPHGRWDL